MPMIHLNIGPVLKGRCRLNPRNADRMQAIYSRSEQRFVVLVIFSIYKRSGSGHRCHVRVTHTYHIVCYIGEGHSCLQEGNEAASSL